MIKNNIKKLISMDRPEVAIEELLAYPDIDETIKNHILLQSAKLKKAQKDRIDGIISLEEFRIELARVNHSILEILQMLNENQVVENQELNIIKLYQKENEPFPVYSALISNNTPTTQILYELEVNVIGYHPYASIPKTRELSKIATWDIRLPYGEGKFRTFPPNPVLIDKDDAAMIDLRFYCTYGEEKLHPNKAAGFEFFLIFHSDKKIKVQSDVIKL